MSGAEGSSVEAASKLTVRQACVDDLGAFLELVRLNLEECGVPFSEDEARWVFAGISRADPAIYLLLDETEPVGFAIARTMCAPLTRAPGMRQEAVFIRADKRSKAAEMLLHLMTLEVFKVLPVHSEIDLLVNDSPYAPEVVAELRRMGFGTAELRMKAVRLPPKPVEEDAGDEADRKTLH